MDLALSSPVQFVPRVGPNMARKLEKLGIHTVEDLIYHVPFRYNDFSLTSTIQRIQPGEIVTVSGTITSIANVITKRGKKIQVARILDESGSIEVIWFNQPYLLKIIHKDSVIRLSGKAEWFGKKIALMNPDFETVDDNSDAPSLHTGRIVPVYPETEGLTSKWLRGRIAYLISNHIPQAVVDFIPGEIRKSFSLIPVAEALKCIHFPDSKEDIQKAQRRLAFEELFHIQLTSLYLKHEWQTTQTSLPIHVDREKVTSFITSLPFTLTNDQRTSLEEILHDFSLPYPMNRLLEGDVGCGKTVVSAIAMYVMHESGYQSVLMAPTQILAQQHYESISKLLSPYGIDVLLITATSKPTMKPLLDKNPVIIGTHALLGESIPLGTIGLVIIDEQQRFGVDQRTILRSKEKGPHAPHLLTMTATPIPRTIALTLYGNLDVSIINEMPKGRVQVKTWVVPNDKREKAYTWIKQQIRSNSSQAFIICPLIYESDVLTEIKAVTKEYDRLAHEVFPEFTLSLLHGKMKPNEKTKVLSSFRDGTVDILVSTPVVEVGIDIPRASIIMIEGSDRFGLSQLHQLRGRVGRRNQQAYCLLFTQSEDEFVLKRLKAMETIHNGPELASVDLKLRGPGELFGSKQHGIPHLRFGSLFDWELVKETRDAAEQILTHDENLKEHQALREKLNQSIIGKSSID